MGFRLHAALRWAGERGDGDLEPVEDAGERDWDLAFAIVFFMSLFVLWVAIFFSSSSEALAYPRRRIAVGRGLRECTLEGLEVLGTLLHGRG
jgi:hypothetical protein